jgi:hypothetical protein
MHLVQILLPLYDNEGRGFGAGMFRQVKDELVGQFGGVTAYTRAPAEGFWAEGEAPGMQRDQILVHEVMADALDRDWWSAYRRQLEGRFRQQEIVIRAQSIERL